MNNRRYPFLDGIRGVAAILVLMRHTADFWGLKFYRTYLAVDLFFILSGFVIAYAYDGKLESGRMTFKGFVFTRLIRLYPVHMLSVLLCGITWITSKYIGPHNADIFDVNQITLLLLFSLLFLPLHISGNTNLYPLNGPYWSLFFELITNFIYAVIRPFLNIKILSGIMVIFGALVAYSSVAHGNLDIGYSWGLQEIVGGFSRAMFGIFLGVFLYRYKEKLLLCLNRLLGGAISPWFAFIFLAAVLVSPSFRSFDPIIDIFLVLLVFPVMVLYLSDCASSRYENALLILGSASYPIYVLHLPTKEIVSIVNTKFVESIAPLSGILLVVGLIFMAVFIEKIYDLPLRRWLANKVRQR